MTKGYQLLQSFENFYTGGPFAVFPDGSFLVCACHNTIKVVNLSNATIKSTIGVDSVVSLALSPDNKLLFSASSSGKIRVRDLESLMCLRSLEGHEGPVSGMACNASGDLLATAGADKKVLLWDIESESITHSFTGHEGGVTCIMFHPGQTQKILFSGSIDSTIRVWDLTTKKCTAKLNKHHSTVTSMAVTEDGQTLLSAGRDEVVNLWDLRDYSHKLCVPTCEFVEAVCIIPNASPFSSWLDSLMQHRSKIKSSCPVIFFITVGGHGIVRLWDSESSTGCLYMQNNSDVTTSSDEEDSNSGFTSALMLPSGQGLMCVTADKQFLYYNLTENPQGCLEFILSKRLVGYNREVVDMKFLGEEEKYLAVASSVKQVQVYDLASMSCSYVLTGHTDIVLCLDTCISSSGKTLIVTGSNDDSVRVWDAESKLCSGIGICKTGTVGAVAFSKKQGDFFVSGSSDGQLKVWSLSGLSDNEGQSAKLEAKAFVRAHKKAINSVAIRPDDCLVCSGSQDHTAHVWSLPELLSEVKIVGHKGGIQAVEFSPGVYQRVLTASGDKTIKIWNISSGLCVFTYDEHTSSVTRASFISSGTQFVSCGADGLVKLWNVGNVKSIATYHQHKDKIRTLAIGMKTDMLASGGSGINFWKYSIAYEEVLSGFCLPEDADIKHQMADLLKKPVPEKSRRKNEMMAGRQLQNEGRHLWDFDQLGCLRYYSHKGKDPPFSP